MPQFVFGESTVQTLGLDITRPAQRNTYTAIPSGVIYSLLFAPWPSEIWTPEVLKDQADLWEGYWNTNRAVSGVTGIATTQQTNDVTGNLEDVAFVGITSRSGLNTGQVTLRAIEFLPQNFKPRIQQAIAELEAVEASGEG